MTDGGGAPARPQRRTQSERREATRAALIEAGRELFATRGYEAVATADVVQAAGVTRGALYHHFEGKRGLFKAVFESIEQALVEDFANSGLTGDNPLSALSAGIDTFLELSLDLELQQITLLDAPAVLGWEEWHEVQTRYGLAILEAGLGAAMEAEQIQRVPVTELANAMLGALIEGALYVARADDPDAARRQMSDVLRAMLLGLATD